MRDGAVILLTELAKQQNDDTKLCVAASFQNLSLKVVLTDHGFLSALIDISNTTINQRVVWCAMTFSNLTSSQVKLLNLLVAYTRFFLAASGSPEEMASSKDDILQRYYRRHLCLR